jgi:putative ABC transport system permease protein
MNHLVGDLRYGVRLLLKTRLTSAAAMLSLALGIGGTTAMFSVVNGVLLRALPYTDPDRLVMVWSTSRFRERGALSPADFLDYRRDSRLLEGMASVMSSSMSLTGDGQPEQVRVQSVSGNFFTLLGARTLVGRPFVPADDDADAHEQAMLGEALWRNRYGGRDDIIGRQITLADRRVEVVGVVPDTFRFDAPADVWLLGHRGVPRGSPTLGDMTVNRDVHILTSVGRLRPGVAVQSAQAELDAIATRLAALYPQWNTHRGILLEPLHRAIVGDTRTVLLVLFSAVVLLLLIASVNVANLLLVRTQGRTLELAMRTALGASPNRLAAQILAESLLLAAMGGALGIALAFWGVATLAHLAPVDLGRFDAVALDARVLVFATATTALTGVAFGLWPAWRASRAPLTATMNSSARGGTDAGRRRGQQVLVATELAVALVLLVGAGLLFTSFVKLMTVNVGIDPKHVVAADVSLPSERYASDPARKSRFHDMVLERVRTEPGVDEVAMALRAPMSSTINRGVWIEGQPEPRPGELQTMSFLTVSERYFEVLRVPLHGGRPFTRDDHANAPRVAIVNEAFTRRYFAGRNPLGHRIGFGAGHTASGTDPDYWRTIVGVAADTRERPASPPAPTAYIPYRQDGEPWNFAAYVVRSRLPATTAGEAIRRAVLGADPDQPISRVRTIEQAMAGSIAVQRFTTVLATLFAGLALLLAAIGTFGVTSHVVSERRREMGIRLALGARPRDIVRLVLGRTVRVTATATVIGVTIAALVGGWLRTLLFDVKPGDPRTLLAAVAVLMLTALAASYVPVRRALRENPIASLQNE